MKEPRMGHTKMYFPFGALSLVPQIAAFHGKLICCQKVVDTTLGKNPDDGLYYGVLLIVGTFC